MQSTIIMLLVLERKNSKFSREQQAYMRIFQ